MAVTVYRYGLRTRTTGEPKNPGDPSKGRDSARYELPQEIREQLRLAHEMRNKLTENELLSAEQRKATWSAWPQVAAIEADLATAEQRAQELAAEANAGRSADRTIATRPETAAALREANKAARDLRAARREAITAAYPVVKPQLEALKAAQKARVKVIRQEFAARGLYWATYNMCVNDHVVTVKLVEQRRKAGQPAQYRFRRWNGSGTIGLQLQRKATDPPRTPPLIASGQGKWRNVLTLAPWMPPGEWDALPRAEKRRLSRQGRALIAVGGGRTVEIPVTVHRMLPEDADICEASLTVERIAGQWTASLSVTAKIPDPPPAEGRPAVALHCGWRSRRDGSVRVATWASPLPLQIPGTLREVLIPHESGRTGEVIIPASWMDAAGYAPSVRSIRDTTLDALRKKLAAALRDDPVLGEAATTALREDLLTRLTPTAGEHEAQEAAARITPVTAAAVEHWKSPGRFAALAAAWRQQPPPGETGSALAADMEAWRLQDRHLWEAEAHTRHQLTGRRDDTWRQVGAWLSQVASVLVTDDSDLRALRRRPGADDDDPALPGMVQEKACARAALAAPGRLRQFAVQSATRDGLGVREVESAFLSRSCPQCGHVSEAGPQFAAAAMVLCGGCGRAYDQDLSAARLMLARASTEVTP
jgi:hypothetical protein